MSTALSTLRDSLSQKNGDYLHDTVTTALTTSTAVVCTNLTKYTASANYFKDWYVLITSGTNQSSTPRRISASTAAGTLTVYGANFAAETPDSGLKATFELHRYDPTNKLRAINDAARELYPTLHRKLIDEDLITDNILPPYIWDTTATLAVYTEPTGTLLKTTATYLRGFSTSAKVTGSGADDGIVLDSNLYPRLLDLMDKTVSLKCWAMPDVANDAFLDIITTSAAGADTTKSSTTACPVNVFTLLAISDYAVPDDITRIRVKLRVHTTTANVYFLPPRLTGSGIYELMIPQYLQDGHISQVWIQTSSYSDDACDDLHPLYGDEVFGWNIIDDGTYKYIRLPYLSSERKLRLIGDCPLENDLSADTDTITLEGEKLNLLLSYAIYLMYQMQRGVVSSMSTDFYDKELSYWLGKAEMLKPKHRMNRSRGAIRWS